MHELVKRAREGAEMKDFGHVVQKVEL